jgi:hypothetical protein
MACVSAPCLAADPPAFGLTIACPSLGEADQAALEARARAELAAGSPREDDEWSVTCSDDVAVLTWRQSDSVVGRRTVALSQDAAANVDHVLEGLHALVAGRAIDLPGAERAGAAPPPASTPTPVRFAVLLGGDAERWQGNIGYALGVHAGVRVHLGESWSVVVEAGPDWGVGGSAGVHAWSLRGAVLAEDEVVSHLLVGLGASGRLLWTSLDSAAGASPAVGSTAGAVATVKVTLPAGPLRLSAGPRLEAMLRPIVLDVAGAEAFRIPTWVGGVTIDAETK